MNKLVIGLVLFWGLSRDGSAAPAPDVTLNWQTMRAAVTADYRHFYTFPILGQLAAGVGFAGSLASTHGDREVRDWFQNAVRTENTDELAKVVKTFGDGRLTIPLLLGTAFVGKAAEHSHSGALAGKWATDSLRTMLVGAPPLLLLQAALGSSRPAAADSRWHPWQDAHGVSGHSFMGAVPFLAAAQLTEQRGLKALWYLGSTLCGLSRLNDDQHYFSQIALGWWLAYLAAQSIHETDAPHQKVRLRPTISNGTLGMTVQVAF